MVEEIQDHTEQEDLIEKMYRLSSEYAIKHDFRLLGKAFAIIRLITHNVNKTNAYIEIFIPFE